MRKFGAVCLLFVLLLTACSPAVPGGTDGTPSVDTTAAEPIRIDAITVEESRTSLGGDSVKILRYPVATGEGTAALNESLLHLAEEIYAIHSTHMHTMLDEGETFVYEVTAVEIKRFDDALLSILCRAEYGSPADGMLKQFVYTCNLNPATGALYSPDDLITDWTALADLLRGDKGVMAWGSEDLLTQITWNDLLLQIKPAYGIYPSVCFTDDGVVIGFEVLGLLGGTAGFCIPYADAAGCIAVSAPQN